MSHDPLLGNAIRLGPGKWQDADGVWLSETALDWGRAFIRYWTRRESRIRPGEPALRSALAPHGERPWHRRPVQVFFQEDARRIRCGEESDPLKPGAGRLRRRPARLPNPSQAKQLLQALLAKGPVLKSTAIAHLWDRGVSRRMAYKSATELKVRRVWSKAGGPAYWCLPHQKPSVESAYDRAAAFLVKLLADGPSSSEDVMKEGRAAGFSRKQIHEGRGRAGILFRRLRRPGNIIEQGWWFLPGQRLADSPAMKAAESRTEKGTAQTPLPQHAYPVYIVQPNGLPIPVVFAPTMPQDQNQAARQKEGLPADRPRWDEPTSVLFWRGKVIREFRRHPAYNQRELFEKFQQLNWPRSIANPFSNNPRKLQQTVRDVMETLPPNTIRFRCDGMDRVLWEEAE